MKRFTQLVALMVALLLAGQWALADVPCSQWLHSGDDPAPGCCFTAANTTGQQASSGCHGSMGTDSITVGCNSGGCRMAAVGVVAQAITTSKSKGSQAAVIVAIAHIAVVPALPRAARTFASIPAPGPAKYLLFQVFRI